MGSLPGGDQVADRHQERLEFLLPERLADGVICAFEIVGG